jgi:hypothetical protein
MIKLIVISPAIVAIIIFVYMRNVQAKRNDKLRSRFWKAEQKLLNNLSTHPQKIINENDEN